MKLEGKVAFIAGAPGPIDILVNNAGVVSFEAVHERARRGDDAPRKCEVLDWDSPAIPFFGMPRAFP